ncbi:hypothetical protein MBLNU230_g7440t1 [Neophaeotheca triangularis]
MVYPTSLFVSPLRLVPPRLPLRREAPEFVPGEAWTGPSVSQRVASPPKVPGPGFHGRILFCGAGEIGGLFHAEGRWVHVIVEVDGVFRRYTWRISALMALDASIPKPRYLPLKLALHGGDILVPLPSTTDHSGIWPPRSPLQSLPKEILAQIARLVSREDQKNLRLVSKDFERKVSSTYFEAAVVPFTSEVYDTVTAEQCSAHSKATGTGLRVFQSYGETMRKFCMSFVVTEDQLCNLGTQTIQEVQEAYHGGMGWPSNCSVLRYVKLEALEIAAEDHANMKAAFSHLKIAKEIALRVDNGLGWLNGPDVSLWARVFGEPPPVFEQFTEKSYESLRFWSALESSHKEITGQKSLKHLTLMYRNMSKLVTFTTLETETSTNMCSWTPLKDIILSKTLPRLGGNMPAYGSGFFLGSNEIPAITTEPTYLPVVPNMLEQGQKEWLLQSKWAQEAFVATYQLAVINNPSLSARIAKISIAKMSSGLLHQLCGHEFWDSLFGLRLVKILVSPDWRTVTSDEAGVTQTPSCLPTQSTIPVFQSLLALLANKRSVATLHIGYIGGGEHATGQFSRNSHIMPAPIANGPELHSPVKAESLPEFPYVEHLIIENCWISPPNLEGLIKSHCTLSLTKLTLSSVSLTAHPKHPKTDSLILEPTAYMQEASWLRAIWNRISPLSYYHLLNVERRFLAAPGNDPFHGNPSYPSSHGWRAPWFSHIMREGSWVDLLDRLSPGPSLRDYRDARVEPGERDDIANLAEIELISCGYVRLNHAMPFAQHEMGVSPQTPSAWFNARGAHFSSKMLFEQDDLLAWIVQWMPMRELTVLKKAWGLREGWEDAEKAEEATYDGMLPGGTGRFSGVVKKGMGMVKED